MNPTRKAPILILCIRKSFKATLYPPFYAGNKVFGNKVVVLSADFNIPRLIVNRNRPLGCS
jgi:hypothetical protein